MTKELMNKLKELHEKGDNTTIHELLKDVVTDCFKYLNALLEGITGLIPYDGDVYNAVSWAIDECLKHDEYDKLNVNHLAFISTQFVSDIYRYRRLPVTELTKRSGDDIVAKYILAVMSKVQPKDDKIVLPSLSLTQIPFLGGRRR